MQWRGDRTAPLEGTAAIAFPSADIVTAFQSPISRLLKNASRDHVSPESLDVYMFPWLPTSTPIFPSADSATSAHTGVDSHWPRADLGGNPR